MNDRRDFLKHAAIGLGSFPLLAGCRASPKVQPETQPVHAVVDELRTISRRPESYHGWPTLTRRRNGDLLLVWSGGREAHVCPFGRVELMSSADNGQSWNKPRVLWDGPNVGETLQCESPDGGRTWTTPHPIGVWGLPSHLLRMRDGRELMSYGHRRPPFGNQARISDDEGRTWSEPLILSRDSAGGDLGYPSTVELRDDSLLTVWYELPAGKTRAVLRQARWRLGGDKSEPVRMDAN